MEKRKTMEQKLYTYLWSPLSISFSLSNPARWSLLSFGKETLSRSFLVIVRAPELAGCELQSNSLMPTLPLENPDMQVKYQVKKKNYLWSERMMYFNK